tara:strand:- start:53 stop:721 length:669 start_codon:yes stop_codon:yes gene_type:complete
MKIYFDGCSYTWGSELENNEEERYSRLICNELGAEEYNYSTAGGSNDQIVRNLLIEKNIEEYDLAFIQMTYPVRTEHHDDVRNKWVRVNPRYNFAKWLLDPSDKRVREEKARIVKKDINPFYSKIDTLSKKFVDHGEHWLYYYKYIHTHHYSRTKENIQFQTIHNHCKVHNVPVILLTINAWSKLNFDYIVKLNGKTRADKGHPNQRGHEIIASHLLDIWKK